MMQAFLVDILETDSFLEKRRKLLRQRAGIPQNDRKTVQTSAMVELYHVSCCIFWNGKQRSQQNEDKVKNNGINK